MVTCFLWLVVAGGSQLSYPELSIVKWLHLPAIFYTRFIRLGSCEGSTWLGT